MLSVEGMIRLFDIPPHLFPVFSLHKGKRYWQMIEDKILSEILTENDCEAIKKSLKIKYSM